MPRKGNGVDQVPPSDGVRNLASGVGYRNPPKHTQFKKGTSGNPKGRPKGTRGIKASFKRVFEESIQVTLDGRPQYVSAIEAIFLQQRVLALKGDHKAAKLAIDLARKMIDTEDNSNDQLEALFQSLKKGPVTDR